MIRVVLEIALPLLTPIVLYAIWANYDARRKGQSMPGLEEGHWFWVILLGAALTVASLVWFGETVVERGAGEYIPPHVQDGKVVPGQFK